MSEKIDVLSFGTILKRYVLLFALVAVLLYYTQITKHKYIYDDDKVKIKEVNRPIKIRGDSFYVYILTYDGTNYLSLQKK